MQRRAVILTLFAVLVSGCTFPQIDRDFPSPENNACTPSPSVILTMFEMLVSGCTFPQIGRGLPSPENNACTPNTSWELYTVTAGDILSDIAQRTESTVSELMTANCLTDANVLQIGQALRVPRTPVVRTTFNQRGNLAISAHSQPSGVFRLVAGNALKISWVEIPPEIKNREATVEFIFILPSGEEQVIGTTTGIIEDLSGGEASTFWIVPHTPMMGASVRGRVNQYESDRIPVEIIILDVLSFTADRSTVQPGDTLTLNWSVSGGVGGETVRIVERTDFTCIVGEGLPLNGSLSITIPTPSFAVDNALFALEVLDETGTLYTLIETPELRLPIGES